MQRQAQNEDLEQRKQEEMCVKRSELWALYRREEREWLQKSKVKWVNDGDYNTKYFHIMAAARGRINNIVKIQ